MKAINACAFTIIGFFLLQNFSFSSTQGQHVVSHNRQAEKEMYVIFCPFVPFCHKLQLPPTSLHPTSTKWSQSYLLETLNLDQKTQQLFQLHNHKYIQFTSFSSCNQARILSYICLLYTSPSPRDGLLSRMPSSA